MRMETEHPSWLRVLIALGKAAAYFALFLGWQMVVSTVYSTQLTIELMLSNPTADYYALYDLLYDALIAKTLEIALISGLLTLFSLFLFFKLRRRSLRQELWLRPVPGRVFGWCAALAFCLYWVVTLVLSMLPAVWMEDYLVASEGLNQTGVLAFLATAIVAPVVEEVIFRGLMFTRLKRVMPGGLAISLTAIIFGVCHGQLVWFCYALALGLIFGYITNVTESILPAILMHLVFNTTNEIMVLAGEWEPGMVGWIAIFVIAFAGTAFCALRVKRSLSAMSNSEEKGILTEPNAPADLRPVHPERPPEVCWDSDSGLNHKFPPQMR